eukprot:scaffold18609_cov91-Phaeocystis_antarctica.AAC.5
MVSMQHEKTIVMPGQGEGLVRDPRGAVGDDEGRGEDDDRCVDGRVALGEVLGVGFEAEEARGRAQEGR